MTKTRIKKPIWNTYANRPSPRRICDVVVDDSGTYLEIKRHNKQFEEMPWQDLVSQVEAAQLMAKKVG